MEITDTPRKMLTDALVLDKISLGSLTNITPPQASSMDLGSPG